MLAAIAPISVTTKVLRGLTGEAILGHAHTANADLIVMTTHGRGPANRFFLGSVADELVQSAQIPLLLVRPTDTPAQFVPEPSVENILIPLDGSELAEEALAAGIDVAQLLSAKCTLLRVVDPATNGRGQTEANAYLRHVASKFGDSKVSNSTATVFGRHPAESICEKARALPKCIVALSTHGRGGLRRMIFGSVADKVIRAIDMPVLLVGRAGG